MKAIPLEYPTSSFSVVRASFFRTPRSRSPSANFLRFFLFRDLSSNITHVASDFRNFISSRRLMGKPMVRVPIYNDVPTFTFGYELSRRRIENTVRYSNREESQRKEGGGKRERESFMIDHTPFRKLPGNGKAQPRMFPLAFALAFDRSRVESDHRRSSMWKKRLDKGCRRKWHR